MTDDTLYRDDIFTEERSQRTYIVTAMLLIGISFLIMACEAAFLYSPAGILWAKENPGAYGLLTLISFIGSIAGCIMCGFARRSLVLAGCGYALLSVTLGFSAASIVSQYDTASITGAFGMTCAFTLGMGSVGMLFPRFFQKIHGVLIAALIGLLIASILGFFFNFNQNIINWGVLIVFAGFIAYDTYQMANDVPCLENSIIWAAELYLDIINIFIRILAIMGNSRRSN